MQTPAAARSFSEIASLRASRRDVLKGSSALAALCFANRASCTRREEPVSESTLAFAEVAHGADERMHVAAGYTASVLAAWGDTVVGARTPFDPLAQSRERQEARFGTDNDFIAFLPLPRGSSSSTRGLLCVNHEGSALEHMFPRLRADDAGEKATREQIETELAAQGHSVLEIERVDGAWRVVAGSRYARRISAWTPIDVTGPVAGHERLKTSADPTGKRVLGTFNCCSGGVTPWSTVLVGEENFNKYFRGDPKQCGPEARNHERCDVGRELEFHWHRVDPRFELAREPREPNRYGWVVEIDPFDPESTPKKRTALGRFKHEAATCALDPSGRVVVYMGDDDENEFVYRFVTRGVHDLAHPEKSAALLDDGDLHVARFEPDGTLRWIALRHGEEPLTSANGFHSQADVLVEARTAATLVGATPMDRPEDVEASPTSGRVYVMLTNNKLRGPKSADAANPRAKNVNGHVLELSPPSTKDGAPMHAASEFRWEVFLLAGDPSSAAASKTDADAQRARFHPATTKDGWLTCPDNVTFDPHGRLWIATDGAPKTQRMCDGLYATDAVGPGRALTRHFFRAPIGAEICGPCFTPDGRTLFLSVQHPGETDANGKSEGLCFDTPATRFPDFRADMPPRSCVVAITKDDGGAIGG